MDALVIDAEFLAERIVSCDAPSGTRLGWARPVLAVRVAPIVTGRPGWQQLPCWRHGVQG